jgi:hypothetical protein
MPSNSNNAEAMIELGVLEFDWSGSIAPNQGTSAQLYTFEEGPARITLFQNRDEALEAAARGWHS